MLRIIFSLFLSGLFLGSGPCLASCGPVLISYIAATKNNFKEGFFVYLVFSLSRIFVYLVLGILVGIFSQKILQGILVKSSPFFLLTGLFILLLGLLIILGNQPNFRLCKLLQKNLIKKDTKSIIGLGLLFGAMPCLPLVGILSYIGIISKSVLTSLFFMLSFGLGTLVSPLLILSVAAGSVPRLVKRYERISFLFKLLCGLIIMMLGLQVLVRFFMIG